jgi:hypothetical protein
MKMMGAKDLSELGPRFVSVHPIFASPSSHADKSTPDQHPRGGARYLRRRCWLGPVRALDILPRQALIISDCACQDCGEGRSCVFRDRSQASATMSLTCGRGGGPVFVGELGPQPISVSFQDVNFWPFLGYVHAYSNCGERGVLKGCFGQDMLPLYHGFVPPSHGDGYKRGCRRHVTCFTDSVMAASGRNRHMLRTQYTIVENTGLGSSVRRRAGFGTRPFKF